jgi:hypothetical protein
MSVLRRAIALLALSVTLVTGQPQPASAVTFKTLVVDSFEDPSLWSGFYAAPGDARIFFNLLGPRTGQHYAYLNEGAGAGTWASLERLVPGGGAGWICSATIWVIPRGFDSAGHNRFNIEVIDPATFTYVALNPVDYRDTGRLTPYQRFTVGAWQSNLPQLLFRVSQLGGDRQMSSFLDDLTVTCAHF